MTTESFYFEGQEENRIKYKDDFCYVGSEGNRIESNPQIEEKYQCLMKCEGSKTYNQSGFCPDCNMKLVSMNKGHHH